MTFSSTQLTTLNDLALLHFTGVDAISFLQSQLTNAVDQIQSDQAVLAGFCQAKGRLQATMLVWADPNDSSARYVMVQRSIIHTLQKRLNLFLLRAKAKIQISSAQVYGLHNAPTPAYTLPQSVYPVQHQAEFTLIGAPNSTTTEAARAWLIQYQATDSPMPSQRLLSDWQAQDIYAGLAWIQEHNYESFLPQDINLDIIGGVSFKKGCFPGQEVVARLHYRTTARRRAALGFIHGPETTALQANQDIFSTEDTERALGRIINYAYDHTRNGYALLMEVIIDGLEQKKLFVKIDEHTHSIQQQPLPYAWEIAKY